MLKRRKRTARAAIGELVTFNCQGCGGERLAPNDVVGVTGCTSCMDLAAPETLRERPRAEPKPPKSVEGEAKRLAERFGWKRAIYTARGRVRHARKQAETEPDRQPDRLQFWASVENYLSTQLQPEGADVPTRKQA